VVGIINKNKFSILLILLVFPLAGNCRRIFWFRMNFADMRLGRARRAAGNLGIIKPAWGWWLEKGIKICEGLFPGSSLSADLTSGAGLDMDVLHELRGLRQAV